MPQELQISFVSEKKISASEINSVSEDAEDAEDAEDVEDVP